MEFGDLLARHLCLSQARAVQLDTSYWQNPHRPGVTAAANISAAAHRRQPGAGGEERFPARLSLVVSTCVGASAIAARRRATLSHILSGQRIHEIEIEILDPAVCNSSAAARFLRGMYPSECFQPLCIETLAPAKRG